MGATPFIANPSGDADVKPQIHVGLEHFPVTRKTVSDGTTYSADVGLQQGDEIVMGVSLVQKDRQPKLNGELELCRKGVSLVFMGREVAKIVEPTFADRDNFIQVQQRGEGAGCVARIMIGVMRMNTGGCIQT